MLPLGAGPNFCYDGMIGKLWFSRLMQCVIVLWIKCLTINILKWWRIGKNVLQSFLGHLFVQSISVTFS